MSEPPFVHKTAIVEDNVVLGPGCKVWHHAHVRAGAVIGEGSVLGKNVFVDEGVRVGDRSKIQNNVSLYRGVNIGNEVLVGPSAVFTNDLFPRARNEDWEVVTTDVHDGASIGANATIVCGSEVGAWALVGAGSVVTKNVEPHALVAGNPAKRIGWVCRCGVVRARGEEDLPSDACPRCGWSAQRS